MFKVEKWSSVMHEMALMWDDHFAEFGSDELSLAMDMDIYATLEKLGKLHVVTIRKDGKLVGYHVAIVTTHLHHKHDLHATTDFFYILPEYRSGWLLGKLLDFIEQDLLLYGVVRFMSGTRLNKDASAIYKRRGFKEIEKIFAKVLTWKQ